MSRRNLLALLAKSSRQQIFSARVIDVLGKVCSVRLSNNGSQLSNIKYVGIKPMIGDRVIVDYRGLTNPIVMTSTNTWPAELKVRQEIAQRLVPTAILPPIVWNCSAAEYNVPDGLWSPWYHDGTYLCLYGYNNYIRTTDGINWEYFIDSTVYARYTSQYIPQLGEYIGVHKYTEYADGLFHIHHNLIRTPSLDSVSGGIQIAPLEEAGGAYGVSYIPSLGLFMVWGSDVLLTFPSNILLFSSDGVTWWSGHMLNKYWYRPIYSAEKEIFVTVEVNGWAQNQDYEAASYSYDGYTWNYALLGVGNWRGVVYSRSLGLFVALRFGYSRTYEESPSHTPPLSDFAHFATSPDGITWTEYDLPSSYGNYDSIFWLEELNVFICTRDSGGEIISENGFDWTYCDAFDSVYYTHAIWWEQKKMFIKYRKANYTETGSKLWIYPSP